MSDCGQVVKSRKVKKEMLKTAHSKAQDLTNENGGVPPGLATGLGHIRLSLPFVGVEQRWWSAAAVRGGKQGARRIW